MSGVTLKLKLKQFLEEKGAYDQFVLNTRDEKIPISRINARKGDHCFSIAFCWETTPEGYDFWENLANEFNEIEPYEHPIH